MSAQSHTDSAPDAHPIMAGILDDMERTYARMARQPQTVVCRCQRFAFPHDYAPTCAIVAAMKAES